MAAYQQALEQPLTALHIGVGRSKPGSVAATVAAYFLSHQFAELAPSTQIGRRCFLQRFRDQYGAQSINMPAKAIKLILAPMKPHAARSGFKALRALCQFAVDTGMIEADPTQSVPRPKAKTKGHRAWTDEEVAQFEAIHPIGTKARLAHALLLYTGQRVSDVCRMGWQHVTGDAIAVKQQKTHKSLAIPLHPELEAMLALLPRTNMTFVITEYGAPFTAAGLGTFVKKQCRVAGLSHCSAHGLRKAAATRLANAGCSVNEIAAITGHSSLREIARYTKAADQERMARQALNRQIGSEGERDLSNLQPLIIQPRVK